MNINDGVGSTHLGLLQAAVREHGADIGIAHDGDADRCLAVDADGNIVDGDKIMAILAVSMHERGTLTDDTLVVTVMSNLGLRRAMAERGIRVVETKVGDRYVLEALAAERLALGGEQSGHVIMTEFATTGDGVLTGLHLAAEMARTGKSLAELASVMTVYPQVLVNVRGVDHHALDDDEVIAAAVAAVEAELGDSRPRAAAPVGHRADGAGHGRGSRAGGRGAARRRPRRGRARATRELTLRVLASRRRRSRRLASRPRPRSELAEQHARHRVVGALAQHERRPRPGRPDVLQQVRLVDRVPDLARRAGAPRPR